MRGEPRTSWSHPKGFRAVLFRPTHTKMASSLDGWQQENKEFHHKKESLLLALKITRAYFGSTTVQSCCIVHDGTDIWLAYTIAPSFESTEVWISQASGTTQYNIPIEEIEDEIDTILLEKATEKPTLLYHSSMVHYKCFSYRPQKPSHWELFHSFPSEPKVAARYGLLQNHHSHRYIRDIQQVNHIA